MEIFLLGFGLNPQIRKHAYISLDEIILKSLLRDISCSLFDD